MYIYIYIYITNLLANQGDQIPSLHCMASKCDCMSEVDLFGDASDLQDNRPPSVSNLNRSPVVDGVGPGDASHCNLRLLDRLHEDIRVDDLLLQHGLALVGDGHSNCLAEDLLQGEPEELLAETSTRHDLLHLVGELHPWMSCRGLGQPFHLVIGQDLRPHVLVPLDPLVRAPRAALEGGVSLSWPRNIYIYIYTYIYIYVISIVTLMMTMFAPQGD